MALKMLENRGKKTLESFLGACHNRLLKFNPLALQANHN